jgi:hypothetical protein
MGQWGMDLERTHHYCSIGTFVFTVVLVVLVVVPPNAPSDSPGDHPAMKWIMAGILALALVLAGALHLAAARVSRRRRDDPPPPRTEPKSKLEIDTFGALSEEFRAMPWTEKLALHLVYKTPLLHVDVLELQLLNSYGIVTT